MSSDNNQNYHYTNSETSDVKNRDTVPSPKSELGSSQFDKTPKGLKIKEFDSETRKRVRNRVY